MQPQTIRVLKRTCISLGAGLLAATVWILLRWSAPPLRTVGSAAKLTADVSTLGEYPTTVTKIRLSDPGKDAVAWEVSADGVGQLRRLTFEAGQNPAWIDADYGSYRVITPSSSESFFLREGTEYRLELWGGSGVLTKKSASFHFGGKDGQ